MFKDDAMFRVSFFSRTGQVVVGVLLASMVALTVYELWDVAIARWFR